MPRRRLMIKFLDKQIQNDDEITADKIGKEMREIMKQIKEDIRS